ncbi:MAG: radical SAM protein [Myxococcaceae bacterium]|nr:radical SAM protein [Myxococcaceae bacterium]
MSSVETTERTEWAKPASVRPKVRRDAYAVWELTLKCNLACRHCGSRAGDARHDELSTSEALDLVKQMAEAGITEVTLIGGEAFLRPDWLTIAKAINDAGMVATMTTGGFGVNPFVAKKMKEAGFELVSVSIDGLEETHDYLRGKPGSFQQCLITLKNLADAGVPIAFNTQINRMSAPEWPAIYETARDAGCSGWQYGFTVPMGRAADRPELLIQPYELIDLFPVLARVTNRAIKEGMGLYPGNDIGYFGPYDDVLRHSQHARGLQWQGCGAGAAGLGIEADGKIKGCPSLPSQPYTGGNIRDMKLRDIMQTKELTFNLHGGTKKGVEHLWGFCKTCEWAELCRGGCTWTAHVFFDRRGNNPHCHSRALKLKEKGIRERFEQVRKAPGLPFDNGEFKLFEEKWSDPLPDNDPLRFTKEKVRWGESWVDWPWL